MREKPLFTLGIQKGTQKDRICRSLFSAILHEAKIQYVHMELILALRFRPPTEGEGRIDHKPPTGVIGHEASCSV